MPERPDDLAHALLHSAEMYSSAFAQTPLTVLLPEPERERLRRAVLGAYLAGITAIADWMAQHDGDGNTNPSLIAKAATDAFHIASAS